MGTSNIFHPENMNEIVFENRNKSYGAYALRNSYNDHVIKGFFIASFSIALLVLVPTLIAKFKQTEITSAEILKTLPPKIITYYFEIPKPKVKTLSTSTSDNNPSPKAKDLAPIITDKTDDAKTEDKKVEDDLNKEGKGNDVIKDKDTDTGNSGGSKGTDVIDTEAGTVELVAEYMPEFDGDLQKYLSKNIRYPERAREAMITGTVYISFVINEEGSVTDVKLLRGIGGGCDEVAISVIKNMPKWKPGRNKANKPVKVLHNLPIKFTLAKS